MVTVKQFYATLLMEISLYFVVSIVTGYGLDIQGPVIPFLTGKIFLSSSNCPD
jgi:hypothetical protein